MMCISLNVTIHIAVQILNIIQLEDNLMTKKKNTPVSSKSEDYIDRHIATKRLDDIKSGKAKLVSGATLNKKLDALAR